jgi:hypothetical protein
MPDLFDRVDSVRIKWASVGKLAREFDKILTDLGIDHAFIGGLVANEYGYPKPTDDMDLIITREEYQNLLDNKHRIEGLKTRQGTRNMVYKGVEIDFVFPDDSTKYPDIKTPNLEAVDYTGFKIVSLLDFFYLKLLAGRLGDYAAIVDILKRHSEIDANALNDREPQIDNKFRELWQLAQEESKRAAIYCIECGNRL